MIPLILTLEIFIELTQPGGGKIWVEESHISVFRPHLGNCTGKTVVVTSGQTLCVMESPEEIKRKIDEAKPPTPPR